MNDVIFTQHLISIQISCQKFQTKPGFSLPIFLNSVGYISREFFRRFFILQWSWFDGELLQKVSYLTPKKRNIECSISKNRVHSKSRIYGHLKML